MALWRNDVEWCFYAGEETLHPYYFQINPIASHHILKIKGRKMKNIVWFAYKWFYTSKGCFFTQKNISILNCDEKTLQFEENIKSVLFASPSSHHWLQLRMMKNIFKLKENPFWFLHIVLKKRNLLNLFFTRILLSRSSLKSMQLLDWSND